MGRNDFFLDTGPVYGYSDHSDVYHYDDCKKFFESYPSKEHNYYTVMYIMKKELENIRRRRKRDGLLERRAERIVEGKANAILRPVKDVNYNGHPSFPKLYKSINKFLETRKSDTNPKDRDAILLTNAFLWVDLDARLSNPHFITIDRGDIGGKNKGDLIKAGESCLGNKTQLKICLIPNCEIPS